jgi:hypothetical protein
LGLPVTVPVVKPTPKLSSTTPAKPVLSTKQRDSLPLQPSKRFILPNTPIAGPVPSSSAAVCPSSTSINSSVNPNSQYPLDLSDALIASKRTVRSRHRTTKPSNPLGTARRQFDAGEGRPRVAWSRGKGEGEQSCEEEEEEEEEDETTRYSENPRLQQVLSNGGRGTVLQPSSCFNLALRRFHRPSRRCRSAAVRSLEWSCPLPRDEEAVRASRSQQHQKGPVDGRLSLLFSLSSQTTSSALSPPVAVATGSRHPPHRPPMPRSLARHRVQTIEDELKSVNREKGIRKQEKPVQVCLSSFLSFSSPN